MKKKKLAQPRWLVFGVKDGKAFTCKVRTYRHLEKDKAVSHLTVVTLH